MRVSHAIHTGLWWLTLTMLAAVLALVAMSTPVH